MSDIVEFLLARVAEDEAAARAAVDPDRPGIHWQWVTSKTDVPVKPGDVEEALEHQSLSLRTVEEFETASVGRLPGFIIHVADEMEPGAGEHITRWDPARVLAECRAKRAIVDLHGRAHECSVYAHGEVDNCAWCLDAEDCSTLRHLAAVYADHPDFDPAWRVDQ